MQVTGSFIDKVAAEIRRVSDPEASKLDTDISLYRFYAVLLLAKGREVTPEDVHNAWSAWASEHDTENRNLIPYKELSLAMQRRDDVYVDAIRTVAENMRLEDLEGKSQT